MYSLLKRCNLPIFFLTLSFAIACDSKSATENDLSPSTSQEVESFIITQTIDGIVVDREVLIHTPPNIENNKKYPVVMAFHGNGGLNRQWKVTLNSFVNAGEFIGIYPQGYKRSWNLGTEESTADEVEFVNKIVEKLADFNYMDKNRLYAIGYSNGAGIVNKFGVQTTHFKAIAPLATQLIATQLPSEGTSPVAVYQVCGTADRIIPFEGGVSPIGHTFTAAKESAQIWANLFNCDASPTIDFINSDTLFIFKNCNENKEIHFHRVENGGHDLNQENDAEFYARVWAFLQQF